MTTLQELVAAQAPGISTLGQASSDTPASDPEAFSAILTEEEAKVLYKENTRKILNFSFFSISTIKNVNNTSHIPTVTSAIQDLEPTVLELRQLTGHDSLIDLNDLEELAPSLQFLNPLGQQFAQLSLSVTDSVTGLSGLSAADQQRAAELLETTQTKMETLLAQVHQSQSVIGNTANPFAQGSGFNFSSPELVALQLQNQIITSLLNSFNPSGNDPDNQNQDLSGGLDSLFGQPNNPATSNSNNNSIFSTLLGDQQFNPFA